MQKDPAEGHMLHLVVILLYSPSVWNLSLSWSFFDFHDLDIFEDYRPVFLRMFLNQVCLIFPHDSIQIMHFCQELQWK